MSTSNMKRSSAVFRLKKNYKNLDSDDYAHNLKVYFGCVSSVSQITLSDLSYILTGLNAAASTAVTSEKECQEEESQIHKTFKIGEHIAGVWSDENDATGKTLTWHIGIVEAIEKGGVKVSYLLQTNNNDKANWMYPESASTFYTPYEQIIALNLSVECSCITIIRCRLNQCTVNELNRLFAEYMAKL